MSDDKEVEMNSQDQDRMNEIWDNAVLLKIEFPKLVKNDDVREFAEGPLVK